MKVGLFIPCYVDAFFPEVGIATLELLERFGCSIEFPLSGYVLSAPYERGHRPSEVAAEGDPYRSDSEWRSTMSRPVDPESSTLRLVFTKYSIVSPFSVTDRLRLL